ncbi:MAG TPA: neuraminidase-like domain-containing protein, partial [Polyangium sp.]|nr:neuraminidase-like domain-containing protein [Polyangium sp.]
EIASYRDLTQYDEAEWRTILSASGTLPPVGAPADIPGTTETERMNNYAKILFRTLETAFPTAVLANGIKQEANPSMAGVIQFFDNNHNFDFASDRVATYLARTPNALGGVSDVQATTNRIKTLERLFRLTPRYADEMKPLLDAGFDSAASIHRVGRQKFVARFESTMTTARAEQIYDRAAWAAGAATALFGKYSAQLNSLPVYALADLVTLSDNPNAAAADWSTLFGSPDACACEHCQSVYSPAAYLVELLEMLARYNSTLPTSNAGEFFSLRDVLIGDMDNRAGAPEARRPDIARLQLSCANTNTTLPYVDIVNEVLEMVIANKVDEPDHAWPNSISTEGTADELLAEPKILDPATYMAAYVELGNAVHPFDLPWDLWGEEARVYLEKLGVPRYEVLETLLVPVTQAPIETADKVAREKLGLSLRAWEVITQPNGVTLPTTLECWGVSTLDDLTPINQSTSELAPNVTFFLKQSGLTYDELRELLVTDYVFPQLTLTPQDTCNIDDLVLSSLNETNLGRMHRFLRLRLRSGLTITEMDRITRTFGATDMSANIVRHVADILPLKEELGLSVSALLPFWGNMGTKSNEWSPSIYEQVFLAPRVLTQSRVFENIPADALLNQHIPGLLAALQITAAEFALLTSDPVSRAIMGLDALFPANTPMDLPNLSRLYRIVTFARALGLSLFEYLVLRELSGNAALEGDAGTVTPAMTRQFVQLVREIKASALNVGELHYLARHVVPVGMTAGMTEEAAGTLVGELAEITGKIALDDAAAPEPVTLEVTRTRQAEAISEKLATVLKIDAAIIQHLLKYVLHSPEFSATGAIADFYEPLETNLDQRKRTLRRLDKLALLTQRLQFGLTEWQIMYPADRPSDWTSLDDMPLEPLNEPSGNSGYRAQFQRLERFVDLARLRDILPEKSKTLGELDAAIGGLFTQAINQEIFFDRIAALTGWSRADVAFLMTHGFGYTGLPPAQIQCVKEHVYLCLHECMEMLKRLRATAEQAWTWANIDTSDPVAVALDIKRVTRTHYSDSSWTEAARQIRDGLREKQRDVLVHYLVSVDGLDGPNKLFERHLIDIEMSACHLTSRIKMAIGSVQTFVQRILLGLEGNITEYGGILALEWSRLKNYRVWEAGRKIFVHPENWVEPELRTDKSEFFQTLESRLLQGEITNDSVESAYREYLESLHDVARLEVAAITHEIGIQADGNFVDILHMFARTHAAPHKYYYRKRMWGAYWTPWEKVDVDIQGDHLLATIWNRRVYLFWPVFEDGGTQERPELKFRMRLAWTHTTSTGFAPVKVSTGRTFDSPTLEKDAISLTTSLDAGRLSINIFAVTRFTFPNRIRWWQSFVLDACTGDMDLVDRGTFELGIWTPAFAAPWRMHLVEIIDGGTIAPQYDYFWLPSVATRDRPVDAVDVLHRTPGRFSVTIGRALPNVLFSTLPRAVFTYSDRSRVFFVNARPLLIWRLPDANLVYPTQSPRLGPDATATLEPTLQQWTTNTRVITTDTSWNIEYQFHTFYHPYVCNFIEALESKGLDGLLRWTADSPPESVQLLEEEFFDTTYRPQSIVRTPYPIDDVDFTFIGAYGHYNWELFFHAPLLIATRLTQDGRYEDADRWYRTIFDPTAGPPNLGPERFWFVRPFRDIQSLASMQANLDTLSESNAEAQLIKNLLEAQFGEATVDDFNALVLYWMQSPFDPHRIARMRPFAYQKAVVMKYVNHLLSWGDSLFRRETIEAINEATQLYILAQDILGKRPRIIKKSETATRTYRDMVVAVDPPRQLVEIESLISPVPENLANAETEDLAFPVWSYFCIPINEQLLGLWDTVDDRLFKVRHCMDIDGNVRQLPLFEPPIDPALLVRAAAAGLDITTVLAELNAPLPLYRYSVLLPKAMDFVGSVIAMGNGLLSILEKRDGETLA